MSMPGYIDMEMECQTEKQKNYAWDIIQKKDILFINYFQTFRSIQNMIVVIRRFKII
jgi:hypothetical protein